MPSPPGAGGDLELELPMCKADLTSRATEVVVSSAKRANFWQLKVDTGCNAANMFSATACESR